MSNQQADKQISKTAVDSNARNYWEDYFGPYGKMWVRQLPKRVKAALVAELTTRAQRQASKGATVTIPRLISGSIAPLAHAITDDALIFEGVFKGAIEGPEGKPQRFARLFKASWDHEGTLIAFRSVVAP